MIAGSGAARTPSAAPRPGSVAPGGGSVAPAAAAVAASPSTPPGGAPEATTPTDALVGSVLSDRYRVIKKLGEGGMGTVYLAEHTTINKRLAIKVLSSEYCHKQDLVDRFLQEARAASMIEQENVVEITDFGSTPSGSVYFVMEFLNGEDLSQTIKSIGPLQWSRARQIMVQICTALAAAHDVGIVHRDMKPENCYRIKRASNPDFIKVLDFGIAKVISDDGEGKGLTRTGMIFGTPEYMSPEQAKGEKVDHRVDVYAAGVILYELLTGRVPFTADTFMGILTKHMFEAPPAPSSVMMDADIPSDAEAIILKALQKDREYRFQSMEEMKAAIVAVGTGQAAVDVVAEDVLRPKGGETQFNTASPGTVAGTSGFATQHELDTPPKKSSGLLLGIGAVALAGLGGLAVFMISNGGEEKPGAAAPAAAPATPATPAAQPDPTPPPPPADDGGPAVAGDGGKEPPPVPAATVAKITVTTPGIVGTVLDGDDAELGSTNTAFELPVGTDAVDLYVRAAGYEDFPTSVIPDGDKSLSATLVKETSRSPKKKKKKKKKATPATPASVPTPPPVVPKKDPPAKKKDPPSGSPDLKDPFAN